MAFPIIPKRRSGAVGNPTTLELGELAVNTATGKLYLGADAGVAEIGIPVAAGTTVTEAVGDGTTVAFVFGGYNGTDDAGYLVSVGGIDQPPSKYSISATAGGTLTFTDAPKAGEIVTIRAIVAGSGGGGGSGNATQIQGRDVASTAPTAGQVLAWSSTNNRWQPTSLNGSVNFNSAGTHQWAVPAWVRWVYVTATAGDGSNGTATNGQDGQNGTSASDGVPPTTGANGADGTATPGAEGKSISIAAISFALTGGTAGLAGIPGLGGGGAGGGGGFGYGAANGASGSGAGAGSGGQGAFYYGNGTGGAAGGGTATAGGDGQTAPVIGGAGGTGAENGGNGGNGGVGGDYAGGGGGGGTNCSGGGGGGGGLTLSNEAGNGGQPGKGGTADTSMCAGGPGATFNGTVDFSSVANTTINIVISEGAGDASITITW